MTTYRTMGISDLGDNATYADLEAFARACQARQQKTGEDDETVTEYYWGNGDWAERIKHPAGCSCGSPDCPEAH